MLKLRWRDDPQVEIDCEDLKIDVIKADVRVDQIDFDESKRNGARIDQPLVKELIDDYKVAMENGDAFPRVVVWKSPTGYIISCGVQRTAAVRELISEARLPKNECVAAYVLKTTDKMLLEAIARSDNGRHGGRTNHEHRVQHALYMCRTHGMAVKDAARFFVISTTTITSHLRAEKEREHLIKAGIDASGLPVNCLDVLSRIKCDDHSKEEVATLAVQHSPPVDQVKRVVAAIESAKSDSMRTAKVKEFERDLVRAELDKTESRNGKNPRVPKRPRRDYLINTLGRLSQFLNHGLDGTSFTTLDQIQVTNDKDRSLLRTHWTSVSARMKKLVS